MSSSLEYRLRAAAETTHTCDPSGMETFEFPNGQVEKHAQDGSKDIRFPDGTTKLVAPDGTTQTVFADGQVVTEAAA